MYNGHYNSNMPRQVISVSMFPYASKLRTKKSAYMWILLCLQAAQGSEKAVEKDVCYFVNFAPELQEIIAETKYLDYLGILTPSEAQNVALQEDKFLR